MIGVSQRRADEVGRRALALWAALLWILGFEVLPNGHLGLHGVLAPHSHAQAGAHAQHHDEHHEHGHDDHHEHGDHHAHDDHHADEHHADDDEFAAVAGHAGASALDLDHGDHDLLHRGIAALSPPIATPTIQDAAFAQLERVRERRAQLGARAPTTVRARGPPAAATCCAVDCTI